MGDFEDLIYQELKHAMRVCEEEWVQKNIYGSGSGEPLGLLDVAARDVLMDGNVYFGSGPKSVVARYRRYNRGFQVRHFKSLACVGSLLLHGVHARGTFVLSRDDRHAGFEASGPLQVLQRKMQVLMSPGYVVEKSHMEDGVRVIEKFRLIWVPISE